MKQTRNFLRQLLWIFVVTATIAGFHACDDDDLSSPLTIQYMEIANIGPGMSFIANPYYKGGTPSEFSILNIKHNGEEVENKGFEINAETGVITITNNNQLNPGKYTVSIGCKVNNSQLSFADVLTVNMLPAAPATFKYKEPLITFEYGYQDTAIVSEISESVTIEKFLLSPEGDGQYFQIDAKTGMVTLNPKNKFDEPFPGHYKPTIGIQTVAGTEYYPGILEFNITSKILTVSYSPDSLQVEHNASDTSKIAIFKGSSDGLTYSIKSVTPNTEKIKIEASTGRFYLEQGNTPEVGRYKISVTASNSYGSTDFNDVFTCSVITYIEPISEFSYANDTIVYTRGKSISPKETSGNLVKYKFIDLPPTLSSLTIDENSGKITIPKINTIAMGDYTIQVEAKNSKNTITASLKLTVIDNPNKFSSFEYSNNLGANGSAAVGSEYASQFAIPADATYPYTITVPILKDENGEIPTTGVTFEKGEVKFLTNDEGIITINENGSISFTDGIKKGNSYVGYIKVKAIRGKGTENEFTKETRVFINVQESQAGVNVFYKPFVVRMNPQTGGTITAPNITGVSDLSKFLIDYRRSFSFTNLSTNHPEHDGSLVGGNNAETVNPNLLGDMWRTYWKSVAAAGKYPGNINYGSKEPVSMQAKPELETSKICYFDNTQNAKLMVKSDKFKDNSGNYANGFFFGEMTYVINGNTSGINSGAKISPIIIWFDPEF